MEYPTRKQRESDKGALPKSIYIEPNHMTFHHKQQRNLFATQEEEEQEVKMMAKATERVYEDFVPTSDLISEEGCDTLLLYLPGFKKQQLKVQLTTSGILKISGERPIGDNKWKRFHKEFHVPSNCDKKEITAKFEGGILYIRQPKLITPATAQDVKQDNGKMAAEAPKPLPQQQTPPPQPQSQEVTPQQQAPQEERKTESKTSPRESPRKYEDAPPRSLDDEEKIDKKEERKEDGTAGKDEERRVQSNLAERAKQIVGCSGPFKELMRPGNLKKQVVSVLMVLILGIYIAYMFKSFTRNEDQSILEYSQEL